MLLLTATSLRLAQYKLPVRFESQFAGHVFLVPVYDQARNHLGTMKADDYAVVIGVRRAPDTRPAGAVVLTLRDSSRHLWRELCYSNIWFIVEWTLI